MTISSNFICFLSHARDMFDYVKINMEDSTLESFTLQKYSTKMNGKRLKQMRPDGSYDDCFELNVDEGLTGGRNEFRAETELSLLYYILFCFTDCQYIS